MVAGRSVPESNPLSGQIYLSVRRASGEANIPERQGNGPLPSRAMHIELIFSFSVARFVTAAAAAEGGTNPTMAQSHIIQHGGGGFGDNLIFPLRSFGRCSLLYGQFRAISIEYVMV